MTETKKTSTVSPRKTQAKKTIVSKEKESIKEIDYEKQINDLKQMVVDLSKQIGQQPNVSRQKFDPDDDIDVVSLCPGILNLATGGNGHGEVYKFTSFGEVQPIPYSNLKDIVKNNKSFIKAGYFYIDDTEVLKALRLSKICESFIDKDVLLNLFKKSSKVFIKVFSSMPSGQQENFAAMIINKIVHNKPIDLNIAKECGDILKRDLVAEARMTQGFLAKEE